MKIKLVFGSMVLLAGLVAGVEVQAQDASPADIARSIARVVGKMDNRRRDCLKLAAFLKANSDDIESGALSDQDIDKFSVLSEGCGALGNELFDDIDEAMAFFDGGDSGDDDEFDGDGEVARAAGFVMTPLQKATIAVTPSVFVTPIATVSPSPTAIPTTIVTRAPYPSI